MSSFLMHGAASLPALAPYLLLAFAAAGVLAMYVTLKREIHAQAKRNRRVEAMLLRLKEAAPPRPNVPVTEPEESSEEFDPPAASWTTPRPGMNLNRRVQALRLFRRGEDLGHIASALGLPRCEVELLVRVHRLTVAAMANSEHPQPEPSPARPQPAVTGTP